MTDRPPHQGFAPDRLRVRPVLIGTAGIVWAAGSVFLSGCGRDGSTRTDAGPTPVHSIATIGEVGPNPGQFIYPRCLDHDATALWVIDKSARVQRLDPASGKCLAGWMMPVWKNGKPTGLTLAPNPSLPGVEQLIYIPDTHNNRVMIYRAPKDERSEPELVAQFGSYGRGPGEFIYLTDVAVLFDETASPPRVDRIYVSEYGGNDRVSVFDSSYKFLFSFGQCGSSADPGQVEFSRPQSLALDTVKHELIVTDANNHRLGCFTLDGKLVRWIGSPDTPSEAPGLFRYPYGLCLLADGTAMVAEYGNNRVQRIDLDTGECLGIFGAAGELLAPWGVTVLGDRVYALDSANNRVVAFPAPAVRTAHASAPSHRLTPGGPG
jgi:hypothetical protein